MFYNLSLGGHGDPEKCDFYYSCYLGGCGGLEKIDFEQFPFQESVVILKGLIFSNLSLGGCGGFLRTDF